jgi:molecular chaperone DnaK (HSP70)
VAAWKKRLRTWIIGHEFELNQHKFVREDLVIFTNFKLLLYEDYRKSSDAQKIFAKLEDARKSLHDLLTATIAYLWRVICKYLSEDEFGNRRFGPTLKTKVYLSVPKLVNMETSQELGRAAREAGLPCLRLLYETLCAGACILHGIRRRTAEMYERPPAFVSLLRSLLITS